MTVRELLEARRLDLVGRLTEIENRIAEIDYLLNAIEPTETGYVSTNVTRARSPRSLKKDQAP